MKRWVIYSLLLCSAFALQAQPEQYSEAKCERLDARLEKINSQLRAGARAKKGERLKDRRRELKLERHQYCRRS